MRRHLPPANPTAGNECSKFCKERLGRALREAERKDLEGDNLTDWVHEAYADRAQGGELWIAFDSTGRQYSHDHRTNP